MSGSCGSQPVGAHEPPDGSCCNNFALLPSNQNGALAASFTTGKDLDATITYSGTSGDVLTTTTSFVANSAAAPGALPATIAGTFYSTSNSGQRINSAATATLTISGTAFTGPVDCPFSSTMPPPMPTGCTVTGTLTPRTDIAAYDVSLSFADGNSKRFPSGWTVDDTVWSYGAAVSAIAVNENSLTLEVRPGRAMPKAAVSG